MLTSTGLCEHSIQCDKVYFNMTFTSKMLRKSSLCDKMVRTAGDNFKHNVLEDYHTIHCDFFLWLDDDDLLLVEVGLLVIF